MNKSRIVKSAIYTITSFFVLSAVLVGAGVAYTWWAGQSDIDDTPVVVDSAESLKAPILKPTAPAANAKLGASIQMLTTPVAPGINASVIVKTNANSKCNISVLYNEIASKDSGLLSKTADEYGVVSWTWTVESSVPLGKWPVKITCVNGKQSAFVQGDLVVSKTAS